LINAKINLWPLLIVVSLDINLSFLLLELAPQSPLLLFILVFILLILLFGYLSFDIVKYDEISPLPIAIISMWVIDDE